MDCTHIKANANTKKVVKQEVPVATKRYNNDKQDFTQIQVYLEHSQKSFYVKMPIQKRHYYDSACVKLEIKENTPEWLWLTTHIRVATIYQIEEYCFSNRGLVEACKQAANDSCLDLPYLSEKERDFTNEAFVKYKKYIFSEIQDVIRDMHDAGCFAP